jgi:hypothetical protein
MTSNEQIFKTYVNFWEKEITVDDLCEKYISFFGPIEQDLHKFRESLYNYTHCIIAELFDIEDFQTLEKIANGIFQHILDKKDLTLI